MLSAHRRKNEKRKYPHIPPSRAIRRPGVLPRIPPEQRLIMASTPPPESFDGRTEWPGRLPPVQNQGKCGSCFAFATAECLAARTAISALKDYKYMPSVQFLLQCGKSNVGEEDDPCEGGVPAKALQYMVDTHIPTEDYMPYQDAAGTYQDDKNASCTFDPTKQWSWKADSAVTITSGDDALSDETAIQQEIYTNGPVVATFDVYEDFEKNWEGKIDSGVVYWLGMDGDKGDEVGGHAVLIVGWGQTDSTDTVNGSNVPYWIVMNSWGVSGKLGGFCYIKRGDVNLNSGLESDCTAIMISKDNASNVYNLNLPSVPSDKPTPPDNNNNNTTTSIKYIAIGAAIVIALIVAIILFFK